MQAAWKDLFSLIVGQAGTARPRQGWGHRGLPTPCSVPWLGGEYGAGKASNSLKKKFGWALLSAPLFISERPKGSKNTTEQGCQVLGV